MEKIAIGPSNVEVKLTPLIKVNTATPAKNETR